MRTVTVEEHFTIRSLSRRVKPEAVTAHGFFSAEKPYGPADPGAKMDDIAEARLAAMDEAGVTLQVLSYQGPGADLMPSSESQDFAREANDVLAQATRAHSKRFAGFAHLPWTAPEACADELTRCVQEHGFVGAMVNGSTDGRFLDDAAYDPVLARAEALGVPIYIHPGFPPRAVLDAYYSGLPKELSFVFGIAG